MALDKLVDSTQLDADLSSVADAIRAKSGGSASLAFPSGFVSEIGNIPTGGGGDYVAADWLDLTKPDGDIVSAVRPTRYNYNNMLQGRTKVGNVFLTDATLIGENMLASCSVKKLVAPKAGILYTSSVSRCSSLTAVDILGTQIFQSAFIVCSALKTLVLRNTSVCTLDNVTALNNTPFSSSGSGGTLYVPSALISSYQAATNWSTILGYANNSIQAIEGSIYETQYVDGTSIPAT